MVTKRSKVKNKLVKTVLFSHIYYYGGGGRVEKIEQNIKKYNACKIHNVDQNGLKFGV